MLGDNIKRLMKANGYKQKELAIRSGCTESAISKYVNNEREPSIKVLKNLAISLGVTVDELLGNNATADVVEVVRCKDCRFCKLDTFHKMEWCTKMSDDEHTHWVDKDFYCGHGKRKEDE